MGSDATSRPWDVIIIGGGPAGLSAALTLGRCRRNVLICDRGTPRNWATKAIHGFLTRDGIHPDEFQQTAHRELKRYPSVIFINGEAISAKKTDVGFVIAFADGSKVIAKKVLLATGLFDELPCIDGIEEYFGTSVFTCPYCDGWEFQDQRLTAYGKGRRGLQMARALTAWSSKVVLCTDGDDSLSAKGRKKLADNGIALFEQSITGLVGSKGRLQAIDLNGGGRVETTALFFDRSTHHQAALAKELGCQFSKKGGILCGIYESTDVPGVYAAGNVKKDVQLAIVAASEGTKAAFGINRALTREAFNQDG